MAVLAGAIRDRRDDWRPRGRLGASAGGHLSRWWGSGALATAQIFNGSLTRINVTQAKSDYTNAPTVLTDAPEDFIMRGLISFYPMAGSARDVVCVYSPAKIVARLTTDRFGRAGSAQKFDGI